tara:strand:- start:107 stop:652 length:546 start_codon:yes stop_codon:yes gene_type:complete
MTHNVVTVNGASGDRAGNITTTITSNIKEIRIGTNGALSDAYSNSPASALDDSTLYFYDTNPINTISGASISTSSGWIGSVTLPAGRYYIVASFGVTFSASGRFAFQIYDGSSFVGTRAQIGASTQFSTESAPALAVAVVVISGNTTFSVKSASGSTNLDTITDQSTVPSQESWILVRSIS